MVTATFKNGETTATANGLEKYDYGQILRIKGLDLPQYVAVQFAASGMSEAMPPVIGETVEGVTDALIPNSLLRSNIRPWDYTITAYIYIVSGDSGKTEYTITMPVKWRPRTGDDHLDEDPLGVIGKAVEQVNSAATRAETAASEVETTAAEIAADREQIQTNATDISSLKGDLGAIVNISHIDGKNKWNDELTIVGKLDRNTGIVDTNDTTNITSDFSEIPTGMAYAIATCRISTGSKKRVISYQRVCFYDVNKSFISGLASGANPISLPSSAKYIRISNASSALDNMLEFNTDGSYNSDLSSYETYIEPYSEVSIKEQILPDNILKNTDIDLIKDDVKLSILQKSSNLYNGEYLVGRIIRDGSLDESLSTFITTDYIDITNMDGYIVPTVKYGKEIVRNSIAFYNSDKLMISVSYGTYTSSIEIPNGAKYVRVSWEETYIGLFVGNNSDGSIMPYEEYYEEKLIRYFENSKSWYFGKVGSCLGDSITAQEKWQGTVMKKLGCRLVNCGIGGTTISGNYTNAFYQDVRVNSLDSGSDFVHIMGGTNDGLLSLPVGEINRDNTDVLTMCGAFNVLLSKILYKFMHISYYNIVDYSAITQVEAPKEHFYIYISTMVYSGDERGTLDDYADAIKSIAKLWGLPIIDNHYECGLNAMNRHLYYQDLIHPNELGGVLLGTSIINGLRRYEPID